MQFARTLFKWHFSFHFFLRLVLVFGTWLKDQNKNRWGPRGFMWNLDELGTIVYTPKVSDAFASPGRLCRGLCQPARSKNSTTVVLEFKIRPKKQAKNSTCWTGLIRLATDYAIPEPKKKNRRRKVDGKQFFAVIWTNVKFQSQWPTTFWNENVRVMVRVISVICRAQTIFWSESNFAFKFKVPFCWYYHGSKNVFFRVFHQKIMFPWYRAQPVTPPKIQNVRCLTTKGSFASLHFRAKNKKTDPTDEREQLIVDWFGLSISQTMNRYMPRFVPCNAHDGPTRRQWFFH
jgi:hypothetical protein